MLQQTRPAARTNRGVAIEGGPKHFVRLFTSSKAPHRSIYMIFGTDQNTLVNN